MKRLNVKVNGKDFIVEIEEVGTSKSNNLSSNNTNKPASNSLQKMTQGSSQQNVSSSAGNLLSPMPGKIMSIKVSVGETVSKNTVVGVLEAMKMQNELYAGKDGIVRSISVKEGDILKTNELIMVIE